NDDKKLKNKLKEYSSNNIRQKGILLQYWSTNLKGTTSSTNNISVLSPVTNSSLLTSSNSTFSSSSLSRNNNPGEEPSDSKAPAQTETTEELNLDYEQVMTKMLLMNQKKRKKHLENKLRILKLNEERKRKRRSDSKEAIHQVVDKHPDINDTLKRFKRADPFRPRLEVDQPALLQTIIDITSPSAGTDDRRQTELLRSLTTLDKLSEQLQNVV
ncbi:unnamed protein product, partial [Adineta steineri]